MTGSDHYGAVRGIVLASLEILERSERLVLLSELKAACETAPRVTTTSGPLCETQCDQNGHDSPGEDPHIQAASVAGGALNPHREGPRRDIDIREFVQDKSPQSARERLLCLLYWHTEICGKPSARGAELDVLNGQAGGRSYSASGSIAQHLCERQDLRLIERVSDIHAPPSWRLLELGALVVETLPDRTAAVAVGLKAQPTWHSDDVPFEHWDRYSFGEPERTTSNGPDREATLRALLESLRLRRS